MEKNKLRQVIVDQQELYRREDRLIQRDIDLSYYYRGREIVIMGGFWEKGFH